MRDARRHEDHGWLTSSLILSMPLLIEVYAFKPKFTGSSYPSKSLRKKFSVLSIDHALSENVFEHTITASHRVIASGLWYPSKISYKKNSRCRTHHANLRMNLNHAHSKSEGCHIASSFHHSQLIVRYLHTPPDPRPHPFVGSSNLFVFFLNETRTSKTSLKFSSSVHPASTLLPRKYIRLRLIVSFIPARCIAS